MQDKGKGKVGKATVTRSQRGKGSQGGKVENEVLRKGKGKRKVAEVSGSSSSQGGKGGSGSSTSSQGGKRKSPRICQQQQHGGPHRGTRADYLEPHPSVRDTNKGSELPNHARLQEIHPLLFIGNSTAAADKKWVMEEGFSAVINMAKGFKVKACDRVDGVEYHDEFGIHDSGEADLFAVYTAMQDVLVSTLKKGKVLVNCREGRSRCAARCVALVQLQRNTCN